MVKRSDGRWQQELTVTENGRKKQKFFYGRTKAEVLRKIAEYKDISERGKTFTEVSEEWWEDHEPKLSPTTVQSYKRGKGYAEAFFRDKPIKDIRPVDVNRYIMQISSERHFAYKTASNILIVVSVIFKYAIRCGYVDNNPAEYVEVPKNLKRTRRTVPEDADITRIKNSLNCTFGLFAYFAMYSGLRKGELLALTWEDIDFDSRTISVTKSVYNDHNRPGIKPPKTEAGIRSVPLLNRLADVLKPGKGYVFDDNGHPLTEKHFRALYDKYRVESGVQCTAHQLRHLYATMLLEADIPTKDAQRLLGHAQASTTEDVYQEIRKERERKINERLLDVDIMSDIMSK